MAITTFTTINVTYDPQTGTLALDQPQITLSPRTVVTWAFNDPPPNSWPHLFFPSPPVQEHLEQAQQFGPFQYLEPSLNSLTAIGNTGQSGLYSYTLLLLNENGPLATSQGTQASINNPITSPNTSPDALVSYHPDEPNPEQRLRITPNPLLVEQGRTAIWYVKGIPLGHFVSFRFPNSQNQQMTGPFVSFSLSRGFGEAWLANGAGFLSNEPTLPTTGVHYHVSLRNALGTVVASAPDPAIEPLPPPPSTGG